jgi:hypothetical protein
VPSRKICYSSLWTVLPAEKPLCCACKAASSRKQRLLDACSCLLNDSLVYHRRRCAAASSASHVRLMRCLDVLFCFCACRAASSCKQLLQTLLSRHSRCFLKVLLLVVPAGQPYPVSSPSKPCCHRTHGEPQNATSMFDSLSVLAGYSQCKALR